MQIKHLSVTRYRGLEHLAFAPGARTVILGPNNSCKSTVLEALDLLLHPGFGRSRPAPSELDYFHRDPSEGFEIEGVIGELPESFSAEVHQHLEGWHGGNRELVAEPDGDGIEPVVRVRVRGTSEFEVVHEFSKPEAQGARFGAALRTQIGWVFDGRARDPTRQLSFYQGGLLDRVFADTNMEPTIAALRTALTQGAAAVNEEAAIEQVLSELSNDLRSLGLLGHDQAAAFETGAVSQRQLLQTLRLALPTGDATIPLDRQGRGVQRLLLVSTLLRLSAAGGRPLIGGFEEPEEALEPLRQAQLARMLHSLTARGGQIFLVSHSPEIAREFEIDDFVLLDEGARNPRPLRDVVGTDVMQAYESRVDGAVVRGLFARVPVLVEGPSDRGVAARFWRAMEDSGTLPPAPQLGIDFISAEGVDKIPMLAKLLAQAGKAVVAWCELDTGSARMSFERLRREGHCAALLIHDDREGRSNLEGAMAYGASLEALASALTAVAEDRGYPWDAQRTDLLSRAEGVSRETREALGAAPSLIEFLRVLDEEVTRSLVASALGAKAVTPFEMKGARQGRILAEAVIRSDGVPGNFADALLALCDWIRQGCRPGCEIRMP